MPSEPLNTARLCAESLVEQAKALQHLIQSIPGSVNDPKSNAVAKPPSKKEQLASEFVKAHRLDQHLAEFKGGVLKTPIADQITEAIARDETVGAIMPHIVKDPLKDFSELPDKEIVRIVEAYQRHLQTGKQVIDQMNEALEAASKQLTRYEEKGMVEPTSPVVVATLPLIAEPVAQPEQAIETETFLSAGESTPNLDTLMQDLRALQG
jgi:hypothetical protein